MIWAVFSDCPVSTIIKRLEFYQGLKAQNQTGVRLLISEDHHTPLQHKLTYKHIVLIKR